MAPPPKKTTRAGIPPPHSSSSSSAILPPRSAVSSILSLPAHRLHFLPTLPCGGAHKSPSSHSMCYHPNRFHPNAPASRRSVRSAAAPNAACDRADHVECVHFRSWRQGFRSERSAQSRGIHHDEQRLPVPLRYLQQLRRAVPRRYIFIVPQQSAPPHSFLCTPMHAPHAPMQSASLSLQAPGYQYSWASRCKTMGNVNDVIVRGKGQDWVPGACCIISRSARHPHAIQEFLVPLTSASPTLAASLAGAPPLPRQPQLRFCVLNFPAAPHDRARFSLPSPAPPTPIHRRLSWRRAWEHASAHPARLHTSGLSCPCTIAPSHAFSRSRRYLVSWKHPAACGVAPTWRWQYTVNVVAVGVALYFLGMWV